MNRIGPICLQKDFDWVSCGLGVTPDSGTIVDLENLKYNNQGFLFDFIVLFISTKSLQTRDHYHLQYS